MTTKHESFFRYNQMQPYPFRWFTPVVITLFIAASALFSFLNFITTGYNMVSEVSTDPNSTSTQEKWVRGLPSYLSSRLKITCQPALLNPQAIVSTNNSALTYTIAGLSSPVDDQILSSLEYHSNLPVNCSIANIDINLLSLDRELNQISFSRWGPVVRTFVQCFVENTRGHVVVNLTNEYDYEPPDVSLGRISTFLGSGFLTRNESTKPALWWGESMMSWYWAQVSTQSQSIGNEEDSPYTIQKGFLSFSRNRDTDDVASLDYFSVQHRFLDQDDLRRLFTVNVTSVSQLASGNSSESYPNMWIAADTLAKSAYWTIMTDLGQTSQEPTLLTSQRLLSHFTANFSQVRAFNAQAGPATSPFEPSEELLGDAIFQFAPSVIDTSYLCQVPKVKSTGNLLISILIADLVLLQALWRILVLIVDGVLLKDEPHGKSDQASGHDSQEPNLDLQSRLRDAYELRALSPIGMGTAVEGHEAEYQGARRTGYQRQSSSLYSLLGSSSR